MRKPRLKDDLLPVALLLAFAPAAGASSFSASIVVDIPGGGRTAVNNAPSQAVVQQVALKGNGITGSLGGRVGFDGVIDVDAPNGPSNTTGTLGGVAQSNFDDLI